MIDSQQSRSMLHVVINRPVAGPLQLSRPALVRGVLPIWGPQFSLQDLADGGAR